MTKISILRGLFRLRSNKVSHQIPRPPPLIIPDDNLEIQIPLTEEMLKINELTKMEGILSPEERGELIRLRRTSLAGL